MCVVFDDLSDSVDLSAHNGMIQLIKLANDVTYKRIKRLVRVKSMLWCVVYSIIHYIELT